MNLKNNDIWFEIIQPQSLNIILGRKRYGKSCLGYFILEMLHREQGMDCYVYGLPEEKTHLLPDFITPIYDLNLPEESAILLDEAYISFHARSAMSSTNKMMDTLAGLVGQKEIIALFITQQSRKLDIGIVSAADTLLFKMPSMLQAKFERPEIRRLSESVYEKFKDVDGNKKIYTYVMTDDFEGFVTNPKPTFWTEELSKAFAGVEIGGKNINTECNSYNMEIKKKPVSEILEIIGEIKEKDALNPYSSRIESGKNDGMKIEELVKSNNKLFINQYNGIFEVVFPENIATSIEEIIYRHKINPKAPDVILQPPSFNDYSDRQLIDAKAFQFYIPDQNNISTSGYDISNMVLELKNHPVIFTVSHDIQEIEKKLKK
jgi:hypothetical protein